MLFTVIKNNFKLMFRSKAMIAMMILLPILVIAALSSAFHGLLSNGYNMEEVAIGYFFDEESPFYEYEDEFKQAFAEQDIEAKEYSYDQMEEILGKNDVDMEEDIFLYCSKDGCVIATEDTESIQVKFVSYAIKQFTDEYGLACLNMENLMTGGSGLEKVSLERESLPYTKTAEAEDYYGIIEIIYFTWCGLFFLSAVVQSERKNKLQRRFMISPASRFGLYLGKFVPCELMTILSIGISAAASTVLFKVKWGNIPGTIGILLLTSLAATAFGILLVYLVKNLAVSVVLLFGTVWVAGFVGGSFETYMYSKTPESIKLISPLYHVNRTVVEYSTMGHSDYTGSCILYMLAILVVCALLGSLVMNRRMEEN